MKISDVPPTLLYAGMVVLVFLAVAAFGFVLFMPMLQLAQKRKRLAQVQDYRLEGAEDTGEIAIPGGVIGRTAVAITDQMVRSRGLEGRFAGQLERAGLKIQPAEWVLLRVVIAVGTGVLLGFLLNWIALPFGLVFGWLATAVYHRRRARHRTDRFAAALPEGLQLVIGSLRSGFSLIQAFESMAREVGEPLATEFNRMLAETRLGMDIEVALDRLAQRTGNRDLSWAVMAVRVQREVGGNLAEVLASTVTTIQDRELLRGHVRSLSAEGRLSAYILVALPIVMGAFMALFRTEYISPLFTDRRGILMLLLAATLICVGALWLSRAIRVEEV